MRIEDEEVRLALLASGVDPDATPVEAPDEPQMSVEPDEEQDAPALTTAAPAETQSEFDRAVQLSVENAKLQTKLEQMTAELELSKSVCSTAEQALRIVIARLALPLERATIIGLDSADLPTLCRYFNQLNAEFEQRFPNRPVAKAHSEKSSGVDPEMSRRLRAVQSARK